MVFHLARHTRGYYFRYPILDTFVPIWTPESPPQHVLGEHAKRRRDERRPAGRILRTPDEQCSLCGAPAILAVAIALGCAGVFRSNRPEPGYRSGIVSDNGPHLALGGQACLVARVNGAIYPAIGRSIAPGGTEMVGNCTRDRPLFGPNHM